MVVVSESVHPRGLDFSNQRKVVVYRDVHGKSFAEIAELVRNLAGRRPSARPCCQYYHNFSTLRGRKPSQYHNSGRRPWALTPTVKRFLLRTLKTQRQDTVCTCRTLQAALARERGVAVEVSTVQKFLRSEGYRWLPRGQKRKYNAAQMRQRLAFAQAVVALGPRKLRQKLSFSMDGCILPMPPTDCTERLNFLRGSETHMWRKKSERLEPSLAGQHGFGMQRTIDRCVPLWGGLSAGGFAAVTFHQKRKLSQGEWVRALKAGKLVSAIKKLQPLKPNGPWYVLCDNEAFLGAATCCDEYRKSKVHLWRVPPRSPDLNPVERFWAYLRKRLRRLDLRDALNRRPCLGRSAYIARVRQVLLSAHAQNAARHIAAGYLTTCREVVRKGGAASSG